MPATKQKPRPRKPHLKLVGKRLAQEGVDAVARIMVEATLKEQKLARSK